MFLEKSVGNLPANDRLDGFNTLVNDMFFPMGCEPARDYQGAVFGELKTNQLQQLGFAHIKSSPLDVYRRREDISRASDAVYMVKVQVEGECLVQQRGPSSAG